MRHNVLTNPSLDPVFCILEFTVRNMFYAWDFRSEIPLCGICEINGRSKSIYLKERLALTTCTRDTNRWEDVYVADIFRTE